MTNWHIHSQGRLPNGSHVVIATVRSGWPSVREFPAVLLCAPEGLVRVWSHRPSKLLAASYRWPECKFYDAEMTLRPHIPTHWGVQHGSSCVIRQIPDRILSSNTSNLGRLLHAWFKSEQVGFSQRVLGSGERELTSDKMPDSPFYRPVGLTLIPNTEVVVQAIHTGVLLNRLQLGIERIYVSEMAWIRVPKIEHTLRALQRRFPRNLVLVKAARYKLLESALQITRAGACEYQFIGMQLEEKCQSDFGHDKFTNPHALRGMIGLRVGNVPRGTRMLFMRQIPVEFDVWKNLDVDGLLDIERAAGRERSKQQKAAAEALATLLRSQRTQDSAESFSPE